MKVVELSPTAVLYIHGIDTWLGKGLEHSEHMEGPNNGLGFSPYLRILM